MRGKTVESTEYFFKCGEDSASVLKINFTDGTSAYIEAYIAIDDGMEAHPALKTNRNSQ